MTRAARSNKRQSKKSPKKGKFPSSVITQDGKTTVRHYNGRRFIRLGEVEGKTLEYVEIYICKGDMYTISLRFRDHTLLDLGIDPGFTIQAEYLKPQGLGDPRVLKRWPAIRT